MKPVGMIAICLAAFVSPMVGSEQEHSGHSSPYAGFEGREIKSLSRADIVELRNGGGWGLALAAELNGVPGPAHLLELSEEISLSDEQISSIQAIFDEMQAEAMALGEDLIDAERAIEAAFREGELDQNHLRSLIARAEAARAELRFIHLSRHLLTPPLLSDEQIAKYNALRGYSGDPCANIPQGHDPELWRLHNNCS